MMTVHWAYNLNVFETNFELIITELNFIFKNSTLFHQNDGKMTCNVFSMPIFDFLNKMAYRIYQ